MLTERDREVMKFLEEHRAITTQQAINIFFDGLEVSAYRRLNQLEEMIILEHYMRGKLKVYKLPEAKEISQHDLFILDFYSWVYANGGQVTEFKKTPRFLKGMLIPDAFIRFDIPYNDQVYEVSALLEIDYFHYTDMEEKLAVWYEKIFREHEVNENTLLIIARPTTGLRYNSKNFETIYTDLKFTNLLRLLFE